MPTWYDVSYYTRLPGAATRMYLPGMNNFALLTTDPSVTVQPSTSAPTTETERFNHANIVAYNPLNETVRASILVSGTALIYVSTASATYYYRYYLATGTSASATTQPSTWTEVTAMDYSRNQASTAGWYDEPSFGPVAREVTVPPRSFLWLRLRGTSWCSTNASTSTGYRSTNIIILVFI